MSALKQKPATAERHAPPERPKKHRLLAQKKAAQSWSITDALVLKDQDVFFLCGRDGQAPLKGRHGFGLYHHDCRFLRGYEFRLNDAKPMPLIASARKGLLGVLQFTNAAFRDANGRHVSADEVGLNLQRAIDANRRVLRDEFILRNYSHDPVSTSLTFSFRAEFEDIFVVRGLASEVRGTLHPPEWSGGTLRFLYEGEDGVCRNVQIRISPEPDEVSEAAAVCRVELGPRSEKAVELSIVVAKAAEHAVIEPREPLRGGAAELENAKRASSDQWLRDKTQFESDSRILRLVMDRSLRDLHLLRSRLDGLEYFAAGVPWFSTLFGRDALISAMQVLAFAPGMAEQTLRLIARHQGREMNKWRNEEPGKVLHELRVGELAAINAIPHNPYYGTVDATPLFLILLYMHAAWTGSMDLFTELRENVERAIEWMDKHGDQDGDGYLDYHSTGKKTLINQGWKDSGDAIVNADGSLARPPIAMVEVQGYAYLARIKIAELYERAGDAAAARDLRDKAKTLRERFDRDFWLDDRDFLAMALQRDRAPVAVLSSNAGHALWSLIVEPKRATMIVDRLMGHELFSGWGIRTLAIGERRYNPIGYHLGTVWPHDNALIAAGLRYYGFDDAARRIFDCTAQAAAHFPAYRLPEVFAGFSRDEFEMPVRYPVACHPQAWAAGAVPYMFQSLLGLFPRALDRQLLIIRPVMPEMANYVTLRNLRVADARVDLHFHRGGDGRVEVNVNCHEGDLDVRVEAESQFPGLPG